MTAGTALHIRPSVNLAHRVSAVAASRMARPRNRAHGAEKVTACQSARGTARRTTVKMTTTGMAPVPYQERWRCAGARLSL